MQSGLPSHPARAHTKGRSIRLTRFRMRRPGRF
nr:MAG TPA: hypothetical protein [Bacteriophage sp.]